MISVRRSFLVRLNSLITIAQPVLKQRDNQMPSSFARAGLLRLMTLVRLKAEAAAQWHEEEEDVAVRDRVEKVAIGAATDKRFGQLQLENQELRRALAMMEDKYKRADGEIKRKDKEILDLRRRLPRGGKEEWDET